MRQKACAKVNIFLKIVGKRGEYHELKSRFVQVNSLYDTLHVKEKQSDERFELVGDFGCALEKNTIYKAFMALQNAGFEKECEHFARNYSLHVDKKIPSFAGLGGGSSDGATFLTMLNSLLDLKLSKDKLAIIGSKVGADVPFFIYDFKSANVSGIGEVVEEFEDEDLDIETFTPPIACDTPKVYKSFRENFKIDLQLADTMSKKRTKELLSEYGSIELNDLFSAALRVYPELEQYRKEGWFFSGSGSSFFKVKEHG